MNAINVAGISYIDLLKIGPFRKLVIGQSLSMAGDAICLATLPVALIRGDFNSGTFGILMAAVGLGTILGSLAGGLLADKRSAKQVLIATDLSRGVVQVLATVLIFYEAASFYLAAAYLFFGVAIGVSRPCAQVLLVSVLPKQVLIVGNSMMNFIDNLVAVILPASVGVMIIVWDPVVGVLLDGVTFFGAAYFTAMIPVIYHRLKKAKLSLRETFRGAVIIRGDSVLQVGLISTLVINVLSFPAFLVVAPFAISARFSDIAWGWCLAASGLGACIGSIFTALWQLHKRLYAVAVVCTLVLAAAFFMLAATDTVWLALVAATFVGVVEASWLTAWSTVLQINSPKEDLGKVIAVETFFTAGLHPFIYLGSGLLGGFIGYENTLSTLAVFSFFGGGLIVLLSIFLRIGDKDYDQM